MLASFNTKIQELSLMQSQWAKELNPLLQLPTSQPSFVTGIKVTTGANVISHKLGRTPQGWILTDTDGAVTLHRSAPFNNLTLTLTSSGSAVISLMVF